jgi:hypothetical protein
MTHRLNVIWVLSRIRSWREASQPAPPLTDTGPTSVQPSTKEWPDQRSEVLPVNATGDDALLLGAVDSCGTAAKNVFPHAIARVRARPGGPPGSYLSSLVLQLLLATPGKFLLGTSSALASQTRAK